MLYTTFGSVKGNFQSVLRGFLMKCEAVIHIANVMYISKFASITHVQPLGLLHSYVYTFPTIATLYRS